MGKTWLIVDGDFMCHRALHTTGKIKNGVIFGYLKSVESLSHQFQATGVVHCFDHGENKRREVLPSYKANRSRDGDAEKYKDLDRQRTRLKKSLLKQLGYRNVLFQDGYEGDDMIASIVIPQEDNGVMAARDRDLYQCLRDNVILYDVVTKKPYTQDEFFTANGVQARDYWKALCLAGCTTDNVPGISGVGLATAFAYLRGDLSPKTKTYERIRRELKVIRSRNRGLVRLPMEGVPLYHPVDDEIDDRRWDRVCQKLEMKSLMKGRV